MKNYTIKLLAALAIAALLPSCMTTYDARGYPVQTVDPAVAVAGIAAAGILGYAIGQNNNNGNYYYGGCQPRYQSWNNGCAPYRCY